MKPPVCAMCEYDWPRQAFCDVVHVPGFQSKDEDRTYYNTTSPGDSPVNFPHFHYNCRRCNYEWTEEISG